MEIKLKAWIHGKMYHDAEAKRLLYNNTGSSIFHTDAIFLMYSGINDKEGHGIYCGDIVKAFAGSTEYGVGEVIFHEGCFMIKWIDDSESNMEFLFSSNGLTPRTPLEVIGNKFDNPDKLWA